MAMFRVVYEIDVEANSAAEAAQEVWDIFNDPDMNPPILDVLMWHNDRPPAFYSDTEGIQSINCEELGIKEIKG
jgi:hypothetical protein